MDRALVVSARLLGCHPSPSRISQVRFRIMTTCCRFSATASIRRSSRSARGKCCTPVLWSGFLIVVARLPTSWVAGNAVHIRRRARNVRRIPTFVLEHPSWNRKIHVLEQEDPCAIHVSQQGSSQWPRREPRQPPAAAKRDRAGAYGGDVRNRYLGSGSSPGGGVLR